MEHRPCNSCKRPATLGSKCVPCYVKRAAGLSIINRMGRRVIYLRSRIWWKDHEEKFISVLTGRVLAIRMGLEPGPVEELVDLFYHGVHTPFRKKGVVRIADELILRIINGASDLAKGGADGEFTGDSGITQDG